MKYFCNLNSDQSKIFFGVILKIFIIGIPELYSFVKNGTFPDLLNYLGTGILWDQDRAVYLV